jgi:hypothetical protein
MEALSRAHDAAEVARALEESGGSGGEGETEAEAAHRREAQARGRRAGIIGEAVRIEDAAAWRPPVVPKTDAERRELLHVLRANALLGAVAAEDGEDADAERAGGRHRGARGGHGHGGGGGSGLAMIVDAMFECAFAAGDVLIQQGDAGDAFYVLASGTCTISVGGKPVLEAHRGMGFGELALLYDAPRAATVTASSPVRCWAIDRETFRKVLIGATVRKRERYSAFLAAVPVLRALAREEILTVVDALHPVRFAAGAVVLREGAREADPRFFIVEEGELCATKAGAPGEVCPRLVAGDFFGERALLHAAPRAATVTAVSACRLLAMDKSAFVRIMGPLHARLREKEAAYAAGSAV